MKPLFLFFSLTIKTLMNISGLLCFTKKQQSSELEVKVMRNAKQPMLVSLQHLRDTPNAEISKGKRFC